MRLAFSDWDNYTDSNKAFAHKGNVYCRKHCQAQADQFSQQEEIGMYRIVILLYTLILAITVVFLSCDKDKPTEPNNPPIITSFKITVGGIELPPDQINWIPGGETATIRVIASDPDGDRLFYDWNRSDGTLFGAAGDSVNWTAPSYTTDAKVTVEVSDGNLSTSGESSFRVNTSGSEMVSTPNTPSGPSSGSIGANLSYSTGGSSSSEGHSLQYRFDWGDGSYSSWSSSTNASHFWSSNGTYSVKAQARCASHTSIESSWSSPKSVTISDVEGDYIRLGTDSIPTNTQGYDLVFNIGRTCLTPETIMGASNGFVITSTGNVTWSFAGSPQDYFYQDVSSSISWSLGGLLFTPYDVDGISPDRFLTGGASISSGGMPIIADEPYFHLILDIGSGQGEICIDSSWIPPAGAWKFSGLTCGQGETSDRPKFIDKNGSDDNHPICITVY